MNRKQGLHLAACASAGAFLLLLHQPVRGEATPPPRETSVPTAEESATNAPPADEAPGRKLEAPSPPAWTQASGWMSYEDMRVMMKSRGVDLAPMPIPSPNEPISPPAMPAFTAGPGPEEQKRLFDVFEAMTPEQQDACFAVARWQSPPRMPFPMPPGYGHRSGDPYAPSYQPRPGSSFPGTLPPGR